MKDCGCGGNKKVKRSVKGVNFDPHFDLVSLVKAAIVGTNEAAIKIVELLDSLDTATANSPVKLADLFNRIRMNAQGLASMSTDAYDRVNYKSDDAFNELKLANRDLVKLRKVISEVALENRQLKAREAALTAMLDRLKTPKKGRK